MNIKDMPKIILHLHLDGSLRPETVSEWLEEDDIEKVRKQMQVDKDCHDLNQYLEKFDLPCKVLQRKENIERASYELYEDLANQGVIYAEVRFAPSKHLDGGLSLDEVVEAAIKGMNKAKAKYNIDGNLILCCVRGDDNEEDNIKTVVIAKKYLNRGVCALDLAGAEALFKTESFANIFELAHIYEIPFTIHAGEADGPNSIKTAILFGAQRIGHGVRCIEDEKLMDYLIKEDITLEVCPISNLQTQAVDGEHPLEELYRKGLCVTLNTDNDTVSNTNILFECEWVLNNTNLTIADLVNMNENAAKSVFANEEKRRELINIVEKYKLIED